MIDQNPSSSTGELSEAHIRSGMAMAVQGAVPLGALGTTLQLQLLALALNLRRALVLTG
jgi:hypothetical protein